MKYWVWAAKIDTFDGKYRYMSSMYRYMKEWGRYMLNGSIPMRRGINTLHSSSLRREFKSNRSIHIKQCINTFNSSSLRSVIGSNGSIPSSRVSIHVKEIDIKEGNDRSIKTESSKFISRWTDRYPSQRYRYMKNKLIHEGNVSILGVESHSRIEPFKNGSIPKLRGIDT